MRVLLLEVLAILIGLGAAPAAARDGEAPPLVVAVEVEEGATADAAQVRKAIAEELGRPVVAPGEVIARRGVEVGAADLLLVAVSRGRVVVSLRQRSDTALARALPAPGDKGARLRTIAWLAGNLARDQATPFLLASHEEPAAGALPAPAAEPPAPAPAAIPTEPPPVEAPPRTIAPPAPALRVEGAAAPPAGDGTWSVTISGGFSSNLALLNSVTLQREVLYVPLAFQLEVIKHRPDLWVWGLGIDYPYEVGTGFGALALGGLERRWGRLGLEVTAGLGLERATSRSLTILRDSSNIPVQYSESYSESFVPYGRALVTGSGELAPGLDLLLRVGAHEILTTDGTGATILVTAIGVRYGFP